MSSGGNKGVTVNTHITREKKRDVCGCGGDGVWMGRGSVCVCSSYIYNSLRSLSRSRNALFSLSCGSCECVFLPSVGIDTFAFDECVSSGKSTVVAQHTLLRTTTRRVTPPPLLSLSLLSLGLMERERIVCVCAVCLYIRLVEEQKKHSDGSHCVLFFLSSV